MDPTQEMLTRRHTRPCQERVVGVRGQAVPLQAGEQPVPVCLGDEEERVAVHIGRLGVGVLVCRQRVRALVASSFRACPRPRELKGWVR
jgi:hypothetical protein